jgi:hypothetical protein
MDIDNDIYLFFRNTEFKSMVYTIEPQKLYRIYNKNINKYFLIIW